jgi:hypothetical protein
MPRQPEGKLVSKIKKAIEAKGGRPFKIQGSEDSFQEVGIPDLLWCFRGRFVGSEVKLPGEPLRPAQRVVLYEIYEAGGIASVLETVEQATHLLRYLDREDALDPLDRHHGICFDRGQFVVGHCKFR